MIKTLDDEAILASHDLIVQEIGGLPGACPDKSLTAALYRVDYYIDYKNIIDIHEIAALYAISIAQGHVFNDGNKRTALIAMYAFLKVNGLLLDAPDEIEDVMVNIAEKQISRSELAGWLKKYTSMI